MQKPERILQIVTEMERAGLESMLMQYYRHIDRDRFQFDFLTHRAARGAYEDEIESMGGRVYKVAPISASTLHRNLRQTETFFTAHPEYRIVHAHMDALSGLPLSAAKRARVPVRIAHAHCTGFHKDAKYLIRVLAKRCIRFYATDFFGCSKDACRFLFGSNVNAFVLPNAINAASFEFNDETRREMRAVLGIQDSLVVGTVGGLRPEKNQGFLLDVFALLLERNKNIVLLLVGDGIERERLERKARLLGIPDKVIFLGARQDIPALLQAMDVFALPSLYEGLGIAAVEAQAAGLPCMITDTLPQEVTVTQLVKREPLSDKNAWANAILSSFGIVRTDTTPQVVAAGYDIHTQARSLQECYLRFIEKV